MSLTRTPRLNARREQEARQQATDPMTIAIYALIGFVLLAMMAAVWLDVIKVVVRSAAK